MLLLDVLVEVDEVLAGEALLAVELVENEVVLEPECFSWVCCLLELAVLLLHAAVGEAIGYLNPSQDSSTLPAGLRPKRGAEAQRGH